MILRLVGGEIEDVGAMFEEFTNTTSGRTSSSLGKSSAPVQASGKRRTLSASPVARP